jgi:ribosomal protein S18 acetylase RimI-like enzyme
MDGIAADYCSGWRLAGRPAGAEGRNIGYGGDMHELARFVIAPVRTTDDLAATVGLFRAYAASLDVDLSYQDFAAELDAMPGKYAPPAGDLLLARDSDNIPVGCVGLRPIDPAGCCEMKRLYVSPAGRGVGLGRNLVDAVVTVAERIGYREMRLDTLPSMAGAQALYRRLGFEVMAPYYDTPVVGTLFMRRFLAPVSKSP